MSLFKHKVWRHSSANWTSGDCYKQEHLNTCFQCGNPMVWCSGGLRLGWHFHFHKHWTFSASLSIPEVSFTDSVVHFHHPESCLFPLPSLLVLSYIPETFCFQAGFCLAKNQLMTIISYTHACPLNKYFLCSLQVRTCNFLGDVDLNLKITIIFWSLLNQVSKFWKYLHLKLINWMWKDCLGWEKSDGVSDLVFFISLLLKLNWLQI